jgi:hypothetical protein
MDGNEDWNVGNVRKTLFKMLVVSYRLREREREVQFTPFGVQ